MKPSQQVVRVRVTDRLLDSGHSVPRENESGPALATWRAKPCNCRVLRTYVTQEGWLLVGDSFRVTAEEWFDRVVGAEQVTDDGVPINLESYRAGKIGAFDVRRVNGLDKTVPLDFAEWPAASFEVGCDHGHQYIPLASVLEACREVRETRRHAERTIVWTDNHFPVT